MGKINPNEDEKKKKKIISNVIAVLSAMLSLLDIALEHISNEKEEDKK